MLKLIQILQSTNSHLCRSTPWSPKHNLMNSIPVLCNFSCCSIVPHSCRMPHSNQCRSSTSPANPYRLPKFGTCQCQRIEGGSSSHLYCNKQVNQPYRLKPKCQLANLTNKISPHWCDSDLGNCKPLCKTIRVV